MVRGLTWVVAGVVVALAVVLAIVPGGPSADVVVPVLLTVAAGSVAMGWAVVARRRDVEAYQRSLELIDAVGDHGSSRNNGASTRPDSESNEREVS